MVLALRRKVRRSPQHDGYPKIQKKLGKKELDSSWDAADGGAGEITRAITELPALQRTLPPRG